MQYTRQEIINKCQQTFDDIESFYKQPFVNYIGKTTDTNEYYTEVIAEFLIDNLDKYIYLRILELKKPFSDETMLTGL